jgi:5'-nucleotidase (lipoprotein e(P4) family)
MGSPAFLLLSFSASQLFNYYESLPMPKLFLVLALLSACSSNRPAVTPAPSATQPKHVKWVRSSAEYPALTLQVYHTATAQVLAQGRTLPSGRWAVILDADETVLDNSEHERRISLVGKSFSDTTWVPWVREGAAPAIPGAVEFIRAVQAAGGRIAIVTNRADTLCAVTRANLEQVGVRAEMVLCKPAGGSDKNPRFQMVERGTAPGSDGPLTVVAWVGDNILDFPGMTQEARTTPAALAPFGTRWFILPNPMYGSWERNAEQ